jgi:spermidine synthase
VHDPQSTTGAAPGIFHESLHEGYAQSFGVRKILFESRTEHQHLVIFESESFGRVMTLDGVVQTTERDEFVYHEMLAHVPLFAHPDPESVLIIGGGDGGLLREVLRHKNIERVVLVEIDGAVIDLCKQYFPNHSQGAFDDPHAQIVIGDGIDFVCNTTDRFDVILSDCTDPIGPGEVLFSSRFYAGVKQALNAGGIFAAQNGSAFLQPDEITTTWQRFAPYFADRWFFTAAVPTYVGGLMTLAWGSDDASLRTVPLATLQQRFAACSIATRYYNPDIHTASFALPEYVKKLLIAR